MFGNRIFVSLMCWTMVQQQPIDPLFRLLSLMMLLRSMTIFESAFFIIQIKNSEFAQLSKIKPWGQSSIHCCLPNYRNIALIQWTRSPQSQTERIIKTTFQCSKLCPIFFHPWKSFSSVFAQTCVAQKNLKFQ